jgi:arginyl-tRNA synthetase
MISWSGDWGTQFGMLIAYLQSEYPNILEDVPDISDLTAIYRVTSYLFLFKYVNKRIHSRWKSKVISSS